MCSVLIFSSHHSFVRMKQVNYYFFATLPTTHEGRQPGGDEKKFFWTRSIVAATNYCNMLVVVYLAIVLHVAAGAFWRVPTKAPSSAVEQPTNEPTTSGTNNKRPRLVIFTHCNINIIVPRNLSQESVIKLDLVVRQSLSDSTGIALSDISVQKHSFSELIRKGLFGVKSYTRQLQWRTPTKSPSLLSPSQLPTPNLSLTPSVTPTLSPPSNAPSDIPTGSPIQWRAPTQPPSLPLTPTLSPQITSIPPSQIPTPPTSNVPSDVPTGSPIQWRAPTQPPSLPLTPSITPTLSPQNTNTPTVPVPVPSQQPSTAQTLSPTQEHSPTQEPSPTQSPTEQPSESFGGASTSANVMETIYLTVQSSGPFDSPLNASSVTSIITHINGLIHSAAMDGSLSTGDYLQTYPFLNISTGDWLSTPFLIYRQVTDYLPLSNISSLLSRYRYIFSYRPNPYP